MAEYYVDYSKEFGETSPWSVPVSKYNAIRTVVDGITFASKMEAARYQELKLMQSAGEIYGLALQPRFPLVVNGFKVGAYVADFEYFTDGARRVIEDVKGVRTPMYNLKKKLVKAIYGIDILETK